MALKQEVFRGTPSLETKRTVLRRLTMEDAEDIYAYARIKDVSEYVTWDQHESIEDTKSFISRILQEYNEDRAGRWGIQWKETGEIIGNIGFIHVDTVNLSSPIVYEVAEQYWGKGIATEVLRRILQFGFETMGLNRIEGVHMLRNEVSGRVLEKVGMSYEGLIREKLKAKGQFWDVQQYAILKRDWDKQRMC